METITWEKNDRVVTITMNRPHSLNAYNSTMLQELQQAWIDFKNDDELWVAILTGAGDRAFSTGADIKEMAADGELLSSVHGQKYLESRLSNRDEGLRILSPKHSLCWKPVICAVNGMCVGGAFHYIADSEIVICSENATFFDTHPDVGVAAIWEPVQMVRRIPYETVMRMMLLGRHERLTAQRAYQVGLVSEVMPLDQLMPRAMEIAQLICRNNIRAVMGTIEATYKSLELGMLDGVRQGLLIRHLYKD